MHKLDEIGIKKVTFWCDSQIVLNFHKTTKTFISYRVKEIKSLVDNKTWKYCTTDENPVDLFTQGITTKNFKTNEL